MLVQVSITSTMIIPDNDAMTMKLAHDKIQKIAAAVKSTSGGALLNAFVKPDAGFTVNFMVPLSEAGALFSTINKEVLK